MPGNQAGKPSDFSEEDWKEYLEAERQAEADEESLRALDALDETEKRNQAIGNGVGVGVLEEREQRERGVKK
jgi:hypothetical protein